MKKLLTSTLAAGLVFALAACGSDEKTSDATTAATTADTVTDETATAETASAETVTGDTMAADAATTGDIDLSGLDELHAEVAKQGIESAAQAGVVLDGPCFVDVVSRLSDADAQLIVDAGIEGNPTLSAEGEALGAELQGCATLPTANS